MPQDIIDYITGRLGFENKEFIPSNFKRSNIKLQLSPSNFAYYHRTSINPSEIDFIKTGITSFFKGTNLKIVNLSKDNDSLNNQHYLFYLKNKATPFLELYAYSINTPIDLNICLFYVA